LRLAFRQQIPIAGVAVKRCQNRGADRQRSPQGYWVNELQVVSGGVVLRELAVPGAHQAADREIEPGRAVLPLVVTIREEIDHLVRQSRLPQDVRHGVINYRIAAPAAFIRKRPNIAYAGHHQAVLYFAHMGLVAGQPGDRTDGARDEQETI
jgi:hypothetical protein